MTVIVTRGPRDGDPVPAPPLRDDHTPYQYEMVYDDGKWRAYGDSLADLVTVLIDRYPDAASEQDKYRARLAYTVTVQVRLQAAINAVYADQVAAATDAQIAVLTGSRTVQPDLTEWDSPVPLVLVEDFFAPHTDAPRTRSTISDVRYPPNIVWLNAVSDEALLMSLAGAGAVAVSQHAAYGA